MKVKFLIFIIVIIAIVTALMILETKREPASFSPVLFGMVDTTIQK